MGHQPDQDVCSALALELRCFFLRLAGHKVEDGHRPRWNFRIEPPRLHFDRTSRVSLAEGSRSIRRKKRTSNDFNFSLDLKERRTSMGDQERLALLRDAKLWRSMNKNRMMTESQRPVCLLAMDGGGMKGLVLATVLEALVERTNLPISRCFDMICGTSTGGVAAVNLAHAESPAQGCAEYRASLERVRHLLLQRSKWQLLRTGYELSKEGTEDAAADIPPAKRHGLQPPPRPSPAPHGAPADAPHTPHMFTVAACQSEDGEWEPYLLRNYEPKTCTSPTASPTASPRESAMADTSASPVLSPLSPRARNYNTIPSVDGASDWPVEDIVQASTAVPALFPPLERDGIMYVDGGVVANNPAPLAIREARQQWPGQPIGLIVSLGCGKPAHGHRAESKRSLNPFYWLRTMVDLAIDPNHVHSDLQNTLLPAIAQECGHPFYFRLNPKIEGGDILTTDPDELEAMQQEARDYCAQSTALDKIAVYLLLLTHHQTWLTSDTGRAEAERLCGLDADPAETSRALKRLRESGDRTTSMSSGTRMRGVSGG